MPNDIDWREVGQEAIKILQCLIQFDTTNPPGNERPAAEYLQGLLNEAGVETDILESAPQRANLIGRLPGSGTAGALMLLGHTDVVYADPDEWTYPPFDGEIHDGYLWGRGTLDMKGFVVMELMTTLLIKRLDIPLKRELVFLAVADEEHMGGYGAGWMLEQHWDKIESEFIINEGGRGLRLDNQTFYLVSTAEKGYGDLQLTARGLAGHSAMPRGANAVVDLSRAIVAIADYEPTTRMTRAVQEMFQRTQGYFQWPTGVEEGQLPDDLTSLLQGLPEEVAQMVGFALHDVYTPTMVHAGIKENVIPNQATSNLNTRTLPGVTLSELLTRIQFMIGQDIEIDVRQFHPGTESPSNTPLFEVIESVMAEADPGCIVTPYMLPATTDSRFFREHGAVAYGFSPVAIPLELARTIHGKDERVPLENLPLGIQRLFRIVTQFCG